KDSYNALFGIEHIIDAQTYEDWNDCSKWRGLQRDLVKPDELFERIERDRLVIRLDRQKTLEEMRELHRKLDLKMPDNYADLFITTGDVASSENRLDEKAIGRITLWQLKAKDRVKIEEAKSALIEILKEVDGPCLSLDAPYLFQQVINLYQDSSTLIRRYGDILKSPMWKTRFFRLDP
ncbi:hypothetical protein HYT51_01365, partial [Candidatus Woesearchaeota archaeon]|nr:hypothetical protein [Candidatus Woesearchaeota archaeon]